MERSFVRRRTPRRLLIVVGLAIVSLVLAAGGAGAAAASPTVEGEITGGNGSPVVAAAGFDLATVGYEQSEFLLSGTATAYTAATPLPSDGKWGATPSDVTADYKTRVVVYRPTNANRFNGNVIVEWLNVSGGLDAGPDWTLTHTQLFREGAVWVGVSAQRVGLDATVAADAARYAAIPPHPGDSFSYDIYSQAGQAIWDNADTLLGGLTPQHVIAMGESQSAGRLVTYFNAVHPLVDVYDGFLVHSRSGAGAALSQAPQPNIVPTSPMAFRDDQDAPVLVFQAETDVFNSNLGARQPDSDVFRLWEVPGTAHFDHYGLAIGPTDIGDGQGAVLNLEAMQNPTNQPSPSFSCNLPINTGPMHWVMNAAIAWLERWVADGTPPPTAPWLETTGVSPVVFATDANGNVLGGVRTPHVDAPIARLGGVGNSGAGPIGQFCRLFGDTVPFTPEQLVSLYENHGQFVAAWNQATQDAVQRGFLLGPDAQELKTATAQSDIAK